MGIMPSDREKRWKEITDRFGISDSDSNSRETEARKVLDAVLPENLAGLLRKQAERSEKKKRKSENGG